MSIGFWKFIQKMFKYFTQALLFCGHFIANAYKIEFKKEQTHLACYPLRRTRNEITPLRDLWNAHCAWNSLSASEMPAGVRGLISFHVRPEEVHFKIDRGSQKWKLSFRGSRIRGSPKRMKWGLGFTEQSFQVRSTFH